MLVACSISSIFHSGELDIVLQCLLFYDYVSKYASLINFFLLNWGFIVGVTLIMFCFGLDLWDWVKIEIWYFLLKLLIGCGRMGTRCSSRSREALNWKNLWVLIVIDSWLTSTSLLFSLMVVTLVLSRLLMRFVFPSFFFMDSTSQLFSFWFWLALLFLQLEMEDGDEIDAMLHQTGGSVRWAYLLPLLSM